MAEIPSEEILLAASTLGDQVNLMAKLQPYLKGVLFDKAEAVFGELLLESKNRLNGKSFENFQSVSYFIKHALTDEQREELAELLRIGLKNIGNVDVILAIAMGNLSVKRIILNILWRFIVNRMSKALKSKL
ncbi:uncharacterized protein LOC129794798 [Lutzomyia longipalpis]|uniref:uncharacterized protein LOC129794798 n=1 Tax=Lutzomyia longipalpis TaxID=7200 RepID=UPI00248425CD|nr:uncharacterized protein LOC129794798 [Lutzomyia longipalpis]